MSALEQQAADHLLDLLFNESAELESFSLVDDVQMELGQACDRPFKFRLITNHEITRIQVVGKELELQERYPQSGSPLVVIAMQSLCRELRSIALPVKPNEEATTALYMGLSPA